MLKGTLVLVTKSVFTKEKTSKQLGEVNSEIIHGNTAQDRMHRSTPRPLRQITHRKPFRGLVVGWSTRISGIHYPGSQSSGFEMNEYDPGEIRQFKRHKVIMVQPLDSQQWNNPVPCLEKDLAELDD